MAVINTVGTSDANMKMRRARCRKTVVGDWVTVPVVCQTES
jgi:hypothetical protein